MIVTEDDMRIYEELHKLKLNITNLTKERVQSNDDITSKLNDLKIKNPELRELYEIIIILTGNIETDNILLKSDLQKLFEDIIDMKIETYKHIHLNKNKIKEEKKNDEKKKDTGKKFEIFSKLMPTSDLGKILVIAVFIGLPFLYLFSLIDLPFLHSIMEYSVDITEASNTKVKK